MSHLNGPAFDTVSGTPPVHTSFNNEVLANSAFGLLMLLGTVKAAYEGQFQCANSIWISASKKCDGYNDCHDSSDESDCGPELYKGARVVRGRDWEWGAQDGNGPGTVIDISTEKWVEVKWDTGHTNVYRMGAMGKYDLHPVVHYGSRVVRGKAWNYGDEDGNPPGQGVVTGFANGWMTVEWDAGNTSQYRHDSASFFYDLMIIDNKPYVGARVVRGIDWVWGDQDGSSPGTITAVLQDGWVEVTWDKNSPRVYRMGFDGKYDLKIVGQQVVENTRVVRGRDWNWGYEDGNPPGPGNVTDATTNVGDWVRVAWDAGKSTLYRMGDNLQYDLRPLACIGGRVARGRDWIWGVQDGVPPSHGTITFIDTDGWVVVQWDAGGINSYRIGAQRMYDLRLLTECGPKS